MAATPRSVCCCSVTCRFYGTSIAVQPHRKWVQLCKRRIACFGVGINLENRGDLIWSTLTRMRDAKNPQFIFCYHNFLASFLYRLYRSEILILKWTPAQHTSARRGPDSALSTLRCTDSQSNASSTRISPSCLPSKYCLKLIKFILRLGTVESSMRVVYHDLNRTVLLWSIGVLHWVSIDAASLIKE